MKITIQLSKKEKEVIQNIMNTCEIPNADLLDHNIDSRCGDKTMFTNNAEDNIMETYIHSDIMIMIMARFNKAIKSIIEIAKGFYHMFSSIEDILDKEDHICTIDNIPEEEYFDNNNSELKQKDIEDTVGLGGSI